MQLVVGRIGRAHGVKGEVTVDVRTDDPETRFAIGRELIVDNESHPRLTVASTRWHSGRLLVQFEEIGDRTATASIRGAYVHVGVDVDELPDDPDEFYDHQLIGLTAQSPAHELLGTIADVLHLGAQDLLAITTTDGRDVLVPFVRAIVTTVDVANKIVVIDDPGGLFDDGAALIARDALSPKQG